MSERERSRSPDRGDPSADNEQKDPPPAGDDDKAPAVPQDSNGDSAPANNSGDGAGGGEEVKLYVGNLDYGTSGPVVPGFYFFCRLLSNGKLQMPKSLAHD